MQQLQAEEVAAVQVMDFGKVLLGQAEVTLVCTIRHDKPTTLTQETRRTHNAVQLSCVIVRIQARPTTYVANIMLTI